MRTRTYTRQFYTEVKETKEGIHTEKVHVEDSVENTESQNLETAEQDADKIAEELDQLNESRGTKMKKEFIIKGWTPFDLLSISKDEFYNVANQEYRKQFNRDIEINYMELCFISKDKIKVTIIEYK